MKKNDYSVGLKDSVLFLQIIGIDREQPFNSYISLMAIRNTDSELASFVKKFDSLQDRYEINYLTYIINSKETFEYLMRENENSLLDILVFENLDSMIENSNKRNSMVDSAVMNNINLNSLILQTKDIAASDKLEFELSSYYYVVTINRVFMHYYMTLMPPSQVIAWNSSGYGRKLQNNMRFSIKLNENTEIHDLSVRCHANDTMIPVIVPTRLHGNR